MILCHVASVPKEILEHCLSFRRQGSVDRERVGGKRRSDNPSRFLKSFDIHRSGNGFRSFWIGRIFHCCAVCRRWSAKIIRCIYKRWGLSLSSKASLKSGFLSGGCLGGGGGGVQLSTLGKFSFQLLGFPTNM